MALKKILESNIAGRKFGIGLAKSLGMAKVKLENVQYDIKVHERLGPSPTFSGIFRSGNTYRLEAGQETTALLDLICGRLKAGRGRMERIPDKLSYSYIGYFDGSEEAKVKAWFRRFGKDHVYAVLHRYCPKNVVEAILDSELSDEERIWVQCLDVFFQQTDVLIIRDERALPCMLLKDYPAIKFLVSV